MKKREEPVRMLNVTLALPADAVEELRTWALDNGTTMNGFFRECLQRKVDEICAERILRADEFVEFAQANAIGGKRRKGGK